PSVVVARGGGARRGRLTLKTNPHAVHLTVTPFAPMRFSSNSYSVLHFSQRTSIAEDRTLSRLVGRSNEASDNATDLPALETHGQPGHRTAPVEVLHGALPEPV